LIPVQFREIALNNHLGDLKLMKKLISTLVLVIVCWGWFGFQVNNNFTWQNSPAIAAESEVRNPADEVLGTDFGQKIDLNNANVRLFRKYRGYYPSLASKIVQNAPYDKVEDVLEIPDLSERQKQLLLDHMEDFAVTPPADVFNEGDDRFNPGIY
jgi:photosystem II PsbU protein